MFGSSAPFHYRGCQFELFEHEYNCGRKTTLMTERALELSIADWWLENHANDDVVEVGAVTPYYWENRIKTIVDPADTHPAVTHRQSLFDIDFTGRTVLSISTVEHIGTSEYNLQALRSEDCVSGLRRILEQSKSCLVTFPTGYTQALDAYVVSPAFKALLEALSINISVFKRNPFGNRYEPYTGVNISIPYGLLGIGTARGVVIIEKN